MVNPQKILIMKKLLIITALFLFAGVAFGQTLKKGAILAIRPSTGLVLKPDVTMNQYLDVLKNKWAPEMEKLFPGTKMFYMKGDRGTMANVYAMVWYFESAEVRDKYFDAEGNWRDEALSARMQASMEMLTEYVVDPGMADFTDWIVL